MNIRLRLIQASLRQPKMKRKKGGQGLQKKILPELYAVSKKEGGDFFRNNPKGMTLSDESVREISLPTGWPDNCLRN